MDELVRPTRVEARPDFHIYLEFSDGSKGEVDLSDLASSQVFEKWKSPEFFRRVHLGDHREIRWNEEIELCADSLYLRLTDKSPDQLFPKLRPEQPHA
jgi:hypothetical protein